MQDKGKDLVRQLQEIFCPRKFVELILDLNQRL